MNSSRVFLFLFKQYGSQHSRGDYTAEREKIQDYKLSCPRTRNFRLLLWQLKFSPLLTQPAHFSMGTSAFFSFLVILPLKYIHLWNHLIFLTWVVTHSNIHPTMRNSSHVVWSEESLNIFKTPVLPHHIPGIQETRYQAEQSYTQLMSLLLTPKTVLAPELVQWCTGDQEEGVKE